MFCFMTSITYQEREKESHPWKIKILIGFGRSLTVICQEELIFVQFHLSLLWFLHVLRLGRAAVSGQSDFLPPTVLSHHSVIVNKIWCFCCYSYSCSLWLGGHYKERDTYTSNKGSSKFQTRISFILGQFHSILFNLCCFIWVFSSLCFAEPAK